MAKLVDLKGEIFGAWTVLDRSFPKKTGHSYWLCRCKCGTEAAVNAADLKSGRSTKCISCRGESNRKAKHPINAVFSHVKGNAKRRGIDFEIDRDYAYEIFLMQNGICALTGLPLKIEKLHGERYSACSASLDRISSAAGYVIGNVQWVYKPINNMKWKLDEAEFIRLCGLVVQHRA